MNFYNEWDAGAAAWLRELIKAGHIPPGIVDERSITEITPGDLTGFTQCHFFCGIGGWPLALNLAGYRSDRPLWTGSPPCQPFSVAGKQLGQLDERHLAPTFMRLVAQCRPPVLFGEQVAAAIGKHWLDDLFTELEGEGYACGAAVLPACSVGAPHKRDRLFFGARLELADTAGLGREWRGSGETGVESGTLERPERFRDVSGGMANTNSQQQRSGGCGGACADDVPARREQDTATASGLCSDNTANPHHGFWSDADWLGCRDGKFRPVEPSTFPLVNGLSRSLDVMRTIETDFLSEVNKYAYENKKRPGQILSALREMLQQEACREREPTGMLFELHEAKILLSFLLCICATRETGTIAGSFTKTNDANCRSFLRSLRVYGKFSGTSRRWESTESRSDQPADFMLALSFLLARYVTPYQQASLDAHASAGRVAMLRGFGNAIVPEVAAQFVKAFSGALEDVRNA